METNFCCRNFCGKTTLFFALAFLFLSFRSDRDILVWSEKKPLTWGDFNGKPEKRFAVASTHYDILKEILRQSAAANTATVKITAVFFRNKSWKKKDWISDEVLAHEQKHFDIVELFARKLRKEIQQDTYKNYEELAGRLNELYDKNDQALDVYQDQYDEETDGSMNGDQQRVWQRKVAEELNSYLDYREAAFTVKFAQSASVKQQ